MGTMDGGLHAVVPGLAIRTCVLLCVLQSRYNRMLSYCRPMRVDFLSNVPQVPRRHVQINNRRTTKYAACN
jgi:hypothetical protein